MIAVDFGCELQELCWCKAREKLAEKSQVEQPRLAGHPSATRSMPGRTEHQSECCSGIGMYMRRSARQHGVTASQYEQAGARVITSSLQRLNGSLMQSICVHRLTYGS